jgi:hypothetical protein
MRAVMRAPRCDRERGARTYHLVTMADQLAANWERALTELRDSYLGQFELLPDGSGHPTTLATRAVARSALPGHVSLLETPELRLIRVQPGPGGFSFVQVAVDDRAEPVIAMIREGKAIASLETGDGGVWIVPDDHGDPPRPLVWAIEHELQRRVDAELARRHRSLALAFDSIGWRDPGVPVPEGPPDVRIGAVSRSSAVNGVLGPQRLTPRDLASDMEASARILLVVPDEVESVVRTARLLYVRGWHHWEFITLAEREAFVALEMSLRLLDADERGHSSLVTFAKLLDRVGKSSPDAPLLSDWERKLGHSFRQNRNALTHPDQGQTITWISWARDSIDASCRLINLMWARRRSRVPADLAWDQPDVSVAGRS